MKIKKSIGSTIFDISNSIFLIMFSIVCFIPLYIVIASSFASPQELLNNKIILFPKEFSLENYLFVLKSDAFVRALMVSIFVTVVGTTFNLIMQFTMAYSLADSELKGRGIFMKMVLFTMLFSGGMIPTYLVVKSLHLTNTIWALIIPTAISPFNLILAVNFFKGISPSLKESARLDGANDLRILWSIILPVSKPALATFAIFYAVGHWNAFFDALIYITDHKLRPLQVVLRAVVILAEGLANNAEISQAQQDAVPPQGIKMAVIVIATLPIITVYPFCQKHFTKGLLVGSVKG